MESRMFQKYRFKFYLNASHYIIINGSQGAVHPHTWEFVLEILLLKKEFVEFAVFEKSIDRYFQPFQNQTLNNIPPFDTILPTLENILERFGEDIRQILREEGGELTQIEGSETPTRTYIISYQQDEQFSDGIARMTQDSMDDMFTTMLNNATRH
ncbi:MAG: 6-carboxytetrahydropterin synthase [Lachnospiraceae bacterium]|jgi:6-pyruvoyltetrahydropterin/6-carboxytetrahydropterin synthase|nr:6-carboxytetrahydropterin synthase [Lachnospiraceae bacterium]MBQ9580578.1 6-carboxytetrahydropterin synthase [Lachnospiraceae bacterium]MBR0434923.1 6-carboxytetrahydropterin synthase [Lachnospiraceae bacterium]MCR5345524.1 6-carboxytetrahydropterin synthase [Lachnospiraceae bacterium]